MHNIRGIKIKNNCWVKLKSMLMHFFYMFKFEPKNKQIKENKFIIDLKIYYWKSEFYFTFKV